MGEVILFPAKAKVSRWRPITPEEYDCLVQFSQNPDLCRRSPFLLAMIERARAGMWISDKQGATIVQAAKDKGIIGPATGNEPVAS
jgi:hypothetical protein